MLISVFVITRLITTDYLLVPQPWILSTVDLFEFVNFSAHFRTPMNKISTTYSLSKTPVSLLRFMTDWAIFIYGGSQITVVQWCSLVHGCIQPLFYSAFERMLYFGISTERDM